MAFISWPRVEEAKRPESDCRKNADQYRPLDNDAVLVPALRTSSRQFSLFFGFGTAMFRQDFSCSHSIGRSDENPDAAYGIGEERICRDSKIVRELRLYSEGT